MSLLQDMKTKSVGKYTVGLVLALGFVTIGAISYWLNRSKEPVEEFITLPKSQWMCIASIIDHKKETLECVVYGKLERNLEKYPPSRRRDNNIPKGQSVQQKE